MVNASTSAHHDGATGQVWCLSPPGMHAVPELHVELTINGQETTANGVLLTRYQPPALFSISPSSGPSAPVTPTERR